MVVGALLVIVLPNPAIAQETVVLRGRVWSAQSGGPVDGVRIEAPEFGVGTLSGADGRWVLGGVGAGPTELRLDRIGYAPANLQVDARPGLPEISVELNAAALPVDGVVVTAGRRSQRLADAPVTVEIVGRRAIESAGVSDLSRVLAEQTGIQLEGGHPAGESVMLQGMGSERVLVLLDGQPLVGRISGQFDLSRIPASAVERVEVVKGPQSSLYGSEAMGGVVNVITRSAVAEPWNLSIGLTGGSQGRADVGGTLRGTVGEVRYVADAGRRLTELAPGIETGQGAMARRWDGLAKLGWSPTADWTIDLQGILIDERQRWKSGQLFNFADNRQTGGELRNRWVGRSTQISASLYWTEFLHHSRRSTGAEPTLDSGDRETQSITEAEFLVNADWLGSPLDFGVEARREATVSGRVVGGERDLLSLEPFAQTTVEIGTVSLVPGVRMTWSEQWGNHFTPRLAGVLRPSGATTIRASVGRGYRAPAFKELYMEFLNIGAGYGYTVRGNPGLSPETSTNVMAGIEWSPGPLHVRGQLFHNGFDQFIETRLVGDSTGVTVYSYGNIADGSTSGVELEAGFSRSGFHGEVGYAFLNAETGEGDPLLGRARHSGRGLIEYALPGRVNAGLHADFSGRAPVQRTDDGLAFRSASTRFDIRAGRTLPGGLELTAGVRNIFDSRPDNAAGYQGRHLYLSAGWQIAARTP